VMRSGMVPPGVDRSDLVDATLSQVDAPWVAGTRDIRRRRPDTDVEGPPATDRRQQDEVLRSITRPGWDSVDASLGKRNEQRLV
jgi:hypothetical protein